MSSSQRRAQEAIKRRGNKNCPHHKGQIFVYKCADCNKLACGTCVTTLHRKHELHAIDDIIPDIERKILNFITRTEQDEIPRIQDKIKEVMSDLSHNKQYFKNLIKDIEKQRDILKSELDNMTNAFTKSCRDLEQGNENILLKQSADLETMIDELSAQVNNCKEALLSANNVQIYDISKDIPSQYRDIKTSQSSSANFAPGNVELERIKSLLGELTISRPNDHLVQTLLKHQLPSTSPDWSIVSQFSPCKGYVVESMCAAPDNQVWICMYNTLQDTLRSRLLLVDDKGNVRRTLEMDASVIDLCLHPSSKNIWFISYNDNQVRESSGSTSMVTFAKSRQKFTTDGDAFSICISGEDSVCIGQSRGIVMYTQKGNVLCRTTGGASPLVRSPHSIAVCPVSGNMAVADWDDAEDGGKGKPRVVVLSHTLQLLHQYDGHMPGHQSPKEPFKPNDVCYTKKGVVITDSKNRSVILVNQKGDYLQTLYTDNVARTGVVCVQSNGDIYVSFWDGRVLVLRDMYW